MNKYQGSKHLLLVSMWLAIACVAIGQSESPDRARSRGGPPPDENPQFFPTGVFGSNQSIMAMSYSWYLRSMGEKPLSGPFVPQDGRVYRLLINTRPYNAPVVVRLSVAAAGTGVLVCKVARDGGHPDVVTLDRMEDVSQEDVQKFMRSLDGANFWSTPAYKPPDIHHTVMGEAAWMLEASNEGRYHLVERGISELGSLKEPLEFLVVSLAKLDLRSLPIGPKAGRLTQSGGSPK